MRSVSWLLYTNLLNQTQCVGSFTRTCKSKHTADGSLILRDRKKVTTSILFQKVCLGWKLLICLATIQNRGNDTKDVVVSRGAGGDGFPVCLGKTGRGFVGDYCL